MDFKEKCYNNKKFIYLKLELYIVLKISSGFVFSLICNTCTI